MQYLLDTPVLLHLIGMQGPHRADSLKLITKFVDGDLNLTINTEVLQEILFVLYREDCVDAALEISEQLEQLFGEMPKVVPADFIGACEIMGKYPGMTSRDAVHLAMAMRCNLKGIVTTDKHLLAVEMISCLLPGQLVRESEKTI